MIQAIFPKRARHEERNDQIAYINWLRERYPDAITIVCPITKLTGSKWSRMKQGHVLKQMGYMPGTLDVTIPEPRRGYHGFFIELKTEAGRLSPTQIEMKDRLEKKGYFVAVAHSFDEAIKKTDAYMRLKKWPTK